MDMWAHASVLSALYWLRTNKLAVVSAMGLSRTSPGVLDISSFSVVSSVSGIIPALTSSSSPAKDDILIHLSGNPESNAYGVTVLVALMSLLYNLNLPPSTTALGEVGSNGSLLPFTSVSRYTDDIKVLGLCGCTTLCMYPT